MKLLKKLVMAATTAAICCTAVLPTVASAETSCGHEYVAAGDHTIKLGSYGEHTYGEYNAICTIDRLELYRVMKCEKCGDEYTVYLGYREEHSSCGL